jgi:hypothetical protein
LINRDIEPILGEKKIKRINRKKSILFFLKRSFEIKNGLLLVIEAK